jgi:hypothetical protein
LIDLSSAVGSGLVIGVPEHPVPAVRSTLEALERDDPRAAAQLHRTVAGLMAGRLASTSRTRRAFTD